MGEKEMVSRSALSRRSLMSACLTAGVAPFVAGPAGARSPDPNWVSPVEPAPLIDPAYEIGPPLPPGTLREVPRLSASEKRRLAPRRSSAPGASTFADSTAVADVPFQFRYDDFDIRELSPEIRPYRMSTRMPIVDTGIHDEYGVRMYRVDGKLYDHPVAQAQYGLQLLESYRLTGYQEYLRRAAKQAQRLVDRRVVHQGGWFYPYPFPFRLHGRYDVYEPPWYSMMAQGQALSLFCRLHQVTNRSRWKAAADATFASFLVTPVAGKPWGVYVRDGLLWLEEYPHPKEIRGDVTYNGHMFATFGLWDYWARTKDARTELLLKGALTTTRDVHLVIRNPGWRSKYCLAHGTDSGHYHTTHMHQHLDLYPMTGDTVFARMADLYYTDFPPDGVRGTIGFAAGTHTGYKFDSAGRILSTKKISLLSRSSAPSTARLKVLGQTGIWYAISAGSLSGYHVREASGRCYQVGTCATLAYPIPRPGVVAVEPVRAYTIDAAGQMTSVLTNYKIGDAVALDARAVLNGVEHLRLAAGDYAQRWVVLSTITRR